MDESNPALRAIYPKSKEIAARIALVVHCINAAVEGRCPDQIVPSELLEAAIAFTSWSIGQTRLIYADAGAVSHEETARIVRFIERFRNREWVTARNVTHWWPTKLKLNAEAARAFMRKVVDLGYAVDNGKTGKDYAIRIKNTRNSSNNLPQRLASPDTESSNRASNGSVTTDNTKPGMLAEYAIEVDNKFSALTTENVTCGATTHDLRKPGDDELSSKSTVDLLLPVTSLVISSNALPSKASTGVCYSVTDAVLQVGDRAVLTGEGNKRPSTELKAIWVVKAIQEQKVAVECETLGHRVFPPAWLTRYA